MSTERVPFTEFASCPKCGATRGRAEKITIFFCYGAPIEGGRSDTACQYGADEHLHAKCQWCSFEFGMDVASGVMPLTADEITDLREIIRVSRG